MSDVTNKDRALNAAISNIEKTFGKGSIMMLGQGANFEVEFLSSGRPSIDEILGGGIPKGRIIEVYGPEASGKTTLAMHFIAQSQKAEGVKCAFIDAEHAFDPAYAKSLGIDINSLLFSQPDHGEQALDIVETLVRSGAVDLIVIDSVAALVPKEEINADIDKIQVGLQARLMSKALRRLTGIISKTKCCVIFINQLRMKIGMMGPGSPETTTGGVALKFYASVRVDVRKIQTLKKGDQPYGSLTRFKIVKNKVASPFQSAVLEVIYGEGISKEGELIDLGVKYGLVEKSGSWFSYNGGKLGQGKEKAKVTLRENPSMCDELFNKIKAKMNNEERDVGDDFLTGTADESLIDNGNSNDIVIED